jgi:hypothetical protein
MSLLALTHASIMRRVMRKRMSDSIGPWHILGCVPHVLLLPATLASCK